MPSNVTLLSQALIGNGNSFMQRAATAFPELALQDILDFLHKTKEGKICWQAMQTDENVIHFTQLCQTIKETYPELGKYLVGIINSLKQNKIKQAIELTEDTLRVAAKSQQLANKTGSSSP